MDGRVNIETMDAVRALAGLNWSVRKISRAMQMDRRKITAILEKNAPTRRTTQDSPICCIKRLDEVSSGTKICLHCGELFVPDCRHIERQKYCSKAACKSARKRDSQRLWAKKNPDYWR